MCISFLQIDISGVRQKLPSLFYRSVNEEELFV